MSLEEIEAVISGLEPEAALIALYEHNGCVRVPNRKRRKKESRDYKKGYEIRLTTRTKRANAVVRRVLRQVGFNSGKPFQKNGLWVQPVYGREAMVQFKKWLKKFGSLEKIEEKITGLEPEAALIALFEHNGYLSVLNRNNKELDEYKKGFEIRLVTKTKRANAAVRRVLRQVGFDREKPFQKNGQWVQPVHGREAMVRVKKWLKEFG